MKPPRKPRNSQPRRARNRNADTTAAAPTPAPSAPSTEGSTGQPTPAARTAHEPVVAAVTPTTEGLSPAAAPTASTETEVAAVSPIVESAGLEEVSPVPRASTRRARAEQIVKDYVPLAVGAGMIPLPGVDLAAIGGLQLKVLASLAALYEIPFSKSQAQSIVTSLLGSVGSTVLAGAALGSVAKFVPVLGTLIGAASIPVAGGVITRAMGRLAIDHFEAGGNMESFDLDVAQKAFLGKIAEAKTALA